MLSRNTLLYGTEDAPAPLIPLRAGPLSLFFQDGDLRSITCSGREVLRRLYVAVRDANWGTVPAKLSSLKKQVRADRFQIQYQADHHADPIQFRWQATIQGTPQGEISFVMDGKALTTFRRNRIGFCAHHPLNGFTGRECEVETTDGWKRSRVPALVAPHQPFLGLKAIRHEIAPGCQAEIRFVGEIFETEDHRNWTDGNFKTYGTPLSLPFPVEIPAGAVIRQSVTVRLIGNPPKPPKLTARAPISLSASGESRNLPEIGISATSTPWQPNREQIRHLQSLQLSHLRVEASSLAKPPAELASLGLPIEMAILLAPDPKAQLEQIAALTQQLKLNVRRWMIYEESSLVTSPNAVRLARSVLGPGFFVGGTRANFAELNRSRPAAGSFDALTFSVNPQVHAFDNLSLAENCAAQRDVVRSAQAFAGSMPVFVSPITLKQQFNPVATGPAAPTPPGALPAQVDPRQMSLFGAGWTLASIKYLAESGAAGATYFETAGWKGVMETGEGSPLPNKFPSIAGTVFPIWHVLADIGEFRGGQVIPCISSRPLDLECLMLRAGLRSRMILANLSPEPQIVEIAASLLNATPHLRILDASTAERAMREPEAFRTPPSPSALSSNPEISRRALLGGAMRLLQRRKGIYSLQLDTCAIACID